MSQLKTPKSAFFETKNAITFSMFRVQPQFRYQKFSENICQKVTYVFLSNNQHLILYSWKTVWRHEMKLALIKLTRFGSYPMCSVRIQCHCKAYMISQVTRDGNLLSSNDCNDAKGQWPSNSIILLIVDVFSIRFKCIINC